MQILRLEFSHYDYKLQKTISAKDFALSIVASADLSHVDKLLNRVDEVNNEAHLKDIRVTFEEFKSFAELRKKLRPLSLALFSYGEVNGLLTREDFQRAASKVRYLALLYACSNLFCVYMCARMLRSAMDMWNIIKMGLIRFHYLWISYWFI